MKKHLHKTVCATFVAYSVAIVSTSVQRVYSEEDKKLTLFEKAKDLSKSVVSKISKLVFFISGCILSGTITSGIWYFFVLKDEKYVNGIPEQLDKAKSKSVYLFGEPSTGKSTLVNKLTGSKFATGAAFGITTDVGFASADFDGKKINFFDTPGIHDNTSIKEKMGIKEAKKRLPQADVILTMFDVSRPLEEKSKNEILRSVKAAKDLNEDAKVFFVLVKSNKIKDLKARKEAINNMKNVFSSECESLNGEFLVLNKKDERSINELKRKILSE